MPEHRQVLLRAGHQTAEVDEGIAALIKLIWIADIETSLSCEENQPGVAWIDFESPRDARRFLNIVARFERKADSLYHRVLRFDGYPSPSWTYDIHPWDDSLIEYDDYKAHLGRSAFHFSVSIRFPRSDIPVLLDRLEKYNARRGRFADQDCERVPDGDERERDERQPSGERSCHAELGGSAETYSP